MRVEEERPVRACASLGAIWTSVGMIMLAVEANSALAGRRAFADAFGGGGALRQWTVVLLVVGGGLAWAGLSLKLRKDAPSIKGYRRLQYATMPLALAFLLVHAWLTWLGSALGTDPGSVYEGLRRALPSYPMIAVYVVGPLVARPRDGASATRLGRHDRSRLTTGPPCVGSAFSRRGSRSYSSSSR